MGWFHVVRLDHRARIGRTMLCRVATAARLAFAAVRGDRIRRDYRPNDFSWCAW